MNDFNDRPVRSSYYLILMFDEVQATLFERQKNIGEGGPISGSLTWISSQTKNKIGADNPEFSAGRSQFDQSLSTTQTFRDDSIMGITQDILETMPTDAGAARSHVANVIDQTSRLFKDGDTMISKGSAIKYVDQFTQQETGVEYCRVWTKDRPHLYNSSTMKTAGNIRGFTSTVFSNAWNLNIYPNSNGNGGFDAGSTNMAPGANGYYAKKYMFSIENLAWKTSNTPGYTYNDLPYCERGPNLGRIMWFPPYDLKISEQNTGRWEENAFLGRPEPVYTYQNAARSGQISFKVIVDHPSVLNLLVKDRFKGMSDEESDNYINAFFAGCVDVDLYDLIRRYATLTPDDVQALMAYLNQNKDANTITQNKALLPPLVSDTATPQNISMPVSFFANLYFYHADPQGSNELTTSEDYADSYQYYMNLYGSGSGEYLIDLDNGLTELQNPAWTSDQQHDYGLLTGNNNQTTIPTADDFTTLVNDQTAKFTNEFTELQNTYTQYLNDLATLKSALSGNTVQDIHVTIRSSTSPVDTDKYNLKLSYRRSYAIIKDLIQRIAMDGYSDTAIGGIKWKNVITAENVEATEGAIYIIFERLFWISTRRKFYN